MPRNVVTAGLLSYIDPRDSASYAGSGTTVTDLSGKGNDWIIQGNVSWDSTNGFGNFTGNSTGSGNKLYAKSAASYYNLKTSQNGTGYTICIWAKSTGGVGAWRGLIKNADGENYIDLYQNATGGTWHQDGSGEYLYYNDGNYVANDSLTMSDSVWRMYVASSFTGGTTTNPTTALTIGNEPNGSATGANAYPWVGNIGAVLIYNRVLNKQELVNNFAAFSSQYGVSGSSGISAAGILTAERILAPTAETGVFVLNSVDKDVQWILAGELYARPDGIKTPTNKTKGTWSYTGSDQSWTVPANIFYVWGKVWGAGGGGGCAGGWTHGAEGGGGGHTYGLIPVTPGETLTIKVPRGGYRTPGATNAYPGGGSSTGGGDNQYAGGGGGYCGIFRGSQPLLIAGGGGGGGSTYNTWNVWNHGGGGGGVEGEHGICEIFTYAGTGGAQGAGGTGGNGNNTGGGAGSSLQGGSVQGSVYGGGGGGGYYGGGSGSYGNGYLMGGGGGGSGYVHTTVKLGATFAAHRNIPAFSEDPDLPKTGSTYTTHAFGGTNCGHGGDGYCVIYY